MDIFTRLPGICSICNQDWSNHYGIYCDQFPQTLNRVWTPHLPGASKGGVPAPKIDVGPKKPVPQVPFEVFQKELPDPQKAWDEVVNMCKGT